MHDFALLSAAPHPSTSATVASLHQVGNLSLAFGASRATARFPRRITRPVS